MKLSKLKENPDNPRTITKENFEKLKNKIKALPKGLELRPILYDKDFIIQCGNMRFKALQELESEGFKIKDSYFKCIEGMTKDEIKDFVIIDNMPFGEWDFDSLANNYDFEDLIDSGFNTKDLDIGLWNYQDEDKLDEIPEVPKEAVSKIGDLFLIDGKHRVLCGDSTKKEDVELLMDGKKADMVFTDPPYGMNLNTNFANGMGQKHGSIQFTGGHNYKKVIGDEKDFDPNFIFELFGYCKEMFLWGADYYSERLLNKNDGSWIVWDKKEQDKNFDFTLSEFELCWSKEKHARKICRYEWRGVIGLSKEDTKKRVHPTQKPVLLARWFIEKFSKGTNSIIDLFLGSGSTLIACEQTKRICYGMEIDPIYIDVILNRYKNLYPEATFECLTRKNFNFKKLFSHNAENSSKIKENKLNKT